jgi:branched-chain amino acid aminotransferase
MPVMDDALPAIWVNGERRPLSGLHLSARDRGFTLADGVFETMRLRGGVVFRLDQHLARLGHSLATF